MSTLKKLGVAVLIGLTVGLPLTLSLMVIGCDDETLRKSELARQQEQALADLNQKWTNKMTTLEAMQEEMKNPDRVVHVPDEWLSQHPFEITSVFLDHLAMLESSGDDHAIGDKGKARGRYQLTQAAWDDVNRRRAARGEGPWDWKTYAHNTAISRLFARDHCEWLATMIAKQQGQVSERWVYWAYRCGYTRSRLAIDALESPPESVSSKWSGFNATFHKKVLVRR